MKTSSLFFLPAALALCPSVVFAQSGAAPSDADTVQWSELISKDIRFKLYGFLRLDAQYSDSRLNDNQVPGWVQSEDPASGIAPGVGSGAKKNDSDFSLHPRMSRVGLNLKGPVIDALGDAATSGKVEVDFYNSGLTGESDSRNALRMRQAYVKLDWTEWNLLAGQTTDLISPLYPAVNNDNLMWGAGNTGDRRVQLRTEWHRPMGPGEVSVAFGIGLTGAITNRTVEGGLRSGENSGEPMLNARVGYSGKTDAGGPWQFGVWGHSSTEDFDAIAAGSDQTYNSSSIGLDARVPIIGKDLWLLGECWTGSNLDDIRGGIFQGVNANGEEIQSVGGFAELGVQATTSMTLHAGFTADDPKDSDLTGNQRSRNSAAYLAARWRFEAIDLGLEYLNWETKYVGFDKGEANRGVAYIAFHF